MKLIILFGPQAVGKMTVGQALEKKTGLRLFHNHMTIELVSRFFDYGSAEGRRLVELFRHEIFEAVSKSDLPGMIFTYIWAFDMQSDWDYVQNLSSLFASRGAEVCYVELCAGIDARRARNTTENRLRNKPTKRDPQAAERFEKLEARYRMTSRDGEIPFENYLKIDNTNRSPESAADEIIARFGL